MTKPRKITLTIVGAAKTGSRWSVTGKNRWGRTLHFTSNRGGFSRGLRVSLTYHTAKRDGELVKSRFSALENIRVNRKLIEGKQQRTRTRSFIKLVSKVLDEYRDGLGDWHVGVGCRSGEILLEGHLIRVDASKLSRFVTPDGVHHTWSRGVAQWILDKQGGEV